ncbi:MAG: type IV pilus assembly protein PilM [Patescibacteria group bacterium]|nr:type IV pilus assembly protein PilM [Patescibacteria group bacterium]MDE1988607.1 type IV pilus assembly protein PilM [Patescibacteria group bacterium]MDE2218238.1 type IV pilus assembly protein PilM [Patescibacteria group bacterium]
MDNPFKNFAKSFFSKKSGSALGIDIGSSSLKLVQVKNRGGKAILETYGEISLGPYAGFEIGRSTNLDADKISEALRDLMAESNVTTNSCGLSIPVNSSLITFIKLPKTVERRLETVIPLEARKYIPVPISEVALNWWVVPEEEETFSEFQNNEAKKQDQSLNVFLAAIHNDAIERSKKIIKSSALESSFFEIELFSNIRSSLDQSLQAQMIFDMGASSTKLYIVERGILRDSHVIDKGSQDITLAVSKSMGISFEEAERMKRTYGIASGDKEKNLTEIASLILEYIFSESSRILLNYQKKYNKNAGKIVLTGGGVNLKGLGDYARKFFQVESVVADPFSKVEFPAFLDDVLKTAGPEFSVAIGVALRKLQDME